MVRFACGQTTTNIRADALVDHSLFRTVPTTRYTIGRTMFETDRIPSGWAERLNVMDEVWVPSAFNARAMLGCGKM